MADDLVFYTNPRSRGRVVRWMLEEVGQPYGTELIEFAGLKAPAYLAVNPMGKVPAIAHGGIVVTETPAICAYLADAFPDAGLAPPPRERGAYYRWMFFAAGPTETNSLLTAMGASVPDDKRPMAGCGAMAEVMDALEGAVSATGYVAGERFSAADVYIASMLNWGMLFGTFEKRPAFEAYVARAMARPAAARAAAIDDALIAQQAR